jgi:hypothetical protein
MPKVIYTLLTSFILIIYPYSSPSKVYASFDEEFDSYSLNQNYWEAPKANLSFDGSVLSLGPLDGHEFSYLYTKPSILSVDKGSIEISIKYKSAGGYGDGIAITDVIPENGTVMVYPARFAQYTMFYIWQNSLPPYFHIATSLCDILDPNCDQSKIRVIYSTSAIDLSPHVIKILKDKSSYSVLLDNLSIFTTSPTDRVANGIWMGHPERLNNSSSWSTFDVDYIRAKNFSFPHYLSQKDPAWAGTEYDTASTWAPSKVGIDRWGCALTSVAMLLQHYDIQTPAGEPVTPLNLNAWLKSQPDGYVGPGLLNWLSVARYVHQSKLAGKSATELEYTRSPYNETAVRTDIQAGHPAILHEPGHFLLAYDTDGDDWLVADPARADRLTASPSATWVSQHQFTPSNTDLSYLLFTTPSGVELTLQDGTGTTVPLDSAPESLSDDVDGSGTTTLMTHLYPKPSTGTYTLLIHNTTLAPITLHGYWYDQDGNVGVASYPVDSVGSETLRLTYDKTSTASGSLRPVDTTPPTPFDLVAPVDGARLSTHDISFSWKEATDSSLPLTYHLQVFDTQNEPVAEATTSALTATATLPDGTYTWIVRACDAWQNCTDSNGMRTFTIAPVPLLPAPRIILAESIWKQALVVWQQVRGADHYHIAYGSRREMLDKSVESRQPYAWLTFPKNGTYYVQVAAVDRAGNVGKPSKIVTLKIHGTFRPYWYSFH